MQAGTQLNRIPRFSFARDLEEFRIPLLTELRGEGGGIYVQKWCARTSAGGHRVLIVDSTHKNIAHYMAGRLTMWELLVVRSGNHGILCDYLDQTPQQAWLVEVEALPISYLPDKLVRHDPELRPCWSTVQQDFLLDEDWDAADFQEAEKVYQEVASFVHAASRNPEAFVRTLHHHTLTSGFSYYHALSRMRSYVPEEDRARASGLSGHSPGVLTVEAPRWMAQQVAEALYLSAKQSAVNAYHRLHAWSRFTFRDAAELPASAISDLQALCRELGLDRRLFVALVDQATPTMSSVDPQLTRKFGILHVAKLLAAYFRRLERLAEPGKGIVFVQDPSLLTSCDAHDDGEKAAGDNNETGQQTVTEFLVETNSKKDS